MSFRELQPGDLADFAAHILALLEGPELSTIDSHVRADLIAAIGDLPAEVATASAEAMAADDLKRSKVAVKNEKVDAVSAVIARVRDTLKVTSAPRSHFELAGFDFPSRTKSRYTACDPSGLSVTGSSDGTNKGVFSGNNTPNFVIYDVWRRDGVDGIWRQHLLTRKQKFVDQGVTPGRFYEYRIRAVAASNTSNFSNSAIVYGVS